MSMAAIRITGGSTRRTVRNLRRAESPSPPHPEPTEPASSARQGGDGDSALRVSRDRRHEEAASKRAALIQAMAKVTMYTPAMSAAWISGRHRYWVYPARAQGIAMPVWPRHHSTNVQAAA